MFKNFVYQEMEWGRRGILYRKTYLGLSMSNYQLLTVPLRRKAVSGDHYLYCTWEIQIIVTCSNPSF